MTVREEKNADGPRSSRMVTASIIPASQPVSSFTAITDGENFGTAEKNSNISGDWNTVPSGCDSTKSDQALEAI